MNVSAAGPQQRYVDEEEEALSPSDGLFGRGPRRSTSSSAAPVSWSGNDYPSHPYTPSHAHTGLVPPATSSSDTVPTSSQVPHVPDVWVSDPSLEPGTTAEQKEQEAQREREYNSTVDHLNSSFSPNLIHNVRPPRQAPISTSGPSSGHVSSSAFSLLNPHHAQPHLSQPSHQRYHPIATRSPTAPGSSSTAPYGSHYGYTPSAAASSSVAGPSRSRRSDTLYSERSSLFSEAPPAYTPSPTSPTTTYNSYNNNNNNNNNHNYQTFSPVSSSARPATLTPASTTMGRPSESEGHGLLAGQTYQAIPQSMGGEPDEEGHYVYPRPRSWRDRVKSFSWRRHWKLVLLGLLLTFVTVGFLVSSFKGVKDEVSCVSQGSQPGIPMLTKHNREQSNSLATKYPTPNRQAPRSPFKTKTAYDSLTHPSMATCPGARPARPRKSNTSTPNSTSISWPTAMSLSSKTSSKPTPAAALMFA